MTGRLHLAPRLRSDYANGGRFCIVYYTQDRNQAAYSPKRVRLLDRASGNLIREGWSEQNGAAQFNWIANRYQGYTVIACNNLQARVPDYPDIEDFVTPEPMP